MSVQIGEPHPRRYNTDGGLVIATSTVSASDTGLVGGQLYRLTNEATTTVYCRWAGAASVADAGFDFALESEGSMVIEAEGTTLNAILSAGTGNLAIAAIDDNF